MDDRELLRKFVADRDQKAFAELVRRHIDMVYSSAARQMRDRSAAEDVTQAVFMLLSRKGGTIRRPGALAGWLLEATRNVALNHLRGESRRRRRELEVAAMNQEAAPEPSSEWESIEPLLDEAVMDLRREDRDAITMRYLKGQSVGEIASAMGISQEAAQKRISRAVERLRAIFEKRGVTVSGGALSSILGLHALGPAPEALGTQILQASAGWVSAGALKGAGILMATTKTKVVAASILAVSMAGGGAVVYEMINRPPSQPPAAVAVAPAAPTPESGPWTRERINERLKELYGLKPGEIVKRVPWTADRDQLMYATYNQRMDQPTSAFVAWIDSDRRAGMQRALNNVSFARAMEHVAEIWSQDLLIPRDMLNAPADGDWSYLQGATREQLAREFSRLVPEVVGKGMILAMEMVEREAIVVRGEAIFPALPFTTPIKKIKYYRGTPDRSPRSGSSETLNASLQRLGSLTNRPIVVESKSDLKQNVITEVFASAQGLGDAPEGAVVDELLASVKQQTSMEFTRETRKVPTWRLVKQTP